MEQITEKKIRARLADKQTRFGDNSIRHLLSIIDEQRGLIAMHEANADEAALKAARLEAEIEPLREKEKFAFQNGHREGGETLATILMAYNESPGGSGPFSERLAIEWRNLRAQVAEARAAGHPVNLFEELANQMKWTYRTQSGDWESGVTEIRAKRGF